MSHKLEIMSVELVDHMGSDLSIVDAARISYDRLNQEVRLPEKDEALLRYLFWHRHTSPFEMVEFKFFIKLPIFVMRQLVRHRTASLNEMSRRYTSTDIMFYNYQLRERDQSKTKQGSGKIIDIGSELYDSLDEVLNEAYDTYHHLIVDGVSSETARVVLPLDLMTKIVWKIDLHNLLHFLDLRLDERAQKEIRILAEKIYNRIRPIVPITMSAFDDWREMKNVFVDIAYPYYKNREPGRFIKMLRDAANLDNYDGHLKSKEESVIQYLKDSIQEIKKNA